jgi:hypothetical protein
MDYNRKFKCEYCDFRGNREQLVSHVEKKHSEFVNNEYTAPRLVYNYLNHVSEGHCIICGSATKWNDKTWKYHRLCGKAKCREEVKARYRKNAIAAKGTYNFAKDPEHLQKMLANRHISGAYTCRDGSKKTYTGSYERKAIEFMDKVLEVDPKDVLMPGPIFEYEYNGQIHKWITDIYYIPYNLVIEVKDGGDNPNRREMVEYREKQVAKEKAIVSLGTYNYLRLTNNNFEQLLQAFTACRLAMINDEAETRKAIIQINEFGRMNCDGICSNRPDFSMLVMKEDGSIKIGLTDKSSEYFIMPENGILTTKRKNHNDFLEEYNISKISSAGLSKIKKLLESKSYVGDTELYDIIFGKEFINESQFIFENRLSKCTLDNNSFSKLARNAITLEMSMNVDSTYITNIPSRTMQKMIDNGITLNESVGGYSLQSSTGIHLATDPRDTYKEALNELDSFIEILKQYGGTI